MVYVVTGAVGFLLMFVLDLASLRSVRFVKPFSVTTAVLVVSFSLAELISTSPTVSLPEAVEVVGWVLCVAFGLLLVYSLFIEIPFRRTYVVPGTSAELVTTGTYGLVRHPGVLWLAGVLATLFIATGRVLILAAFPVWMGLDLIHVYLQDRVYFVRMFGNRYREYQQMVPMLIPTRRSCRRFRRTVLRTGV